MTPAIDNDGWLIDARRRLSPNCDERPADCGIDLAVLHGISLPPGEFGGDDILRLFENRLDCSARPSYDALRGLRVSAHFLIIRTGDITQLFLVKNAHGTPVIHLGAVVNSATIFRSA